jgi:hypothetical protein
MPYYSESIPPLPEVEGGITVDETLFLAGIFKEGDINMYASRAELLEENRNPDDIVDVIVIQDYVHVVGKDMYEYKAMEKTTVPLHVAEILDELNLLYKGGISVASSAYSVAPKGWRADFLNVNPQAG